MIWESGYMEILLVVIDEITNNDHVLSIVMG